MYCGAKDCKNPNEWGLVSWTHVNGTKVDKSGMGFTYCTEHKDKMEEKPKPVTMEWQKLPDPITVEEYTEIKAQEIYEREGPWTGIERESYECYCIGQSGAYLRGFNLWGSGCDCYILARAWERYKEL